MPKVTVVIPAYNAMTYLPETLNSVLKQTFTDFEILIINDGSKDNIIQWASEITDPRVKLISQENQGLPGARNTGIAHAQGEYIAFLDADDLWKATKLEKQVHCLDSKPEVGLVYTWTLLVDQHGRSTGTVTASHTEGKVWEKLLLGDVIGSGSSAMIRRICFENVGLFDTELSSIEDCDMWVRIAARYPLAVIKEVLVSYRQHFTNMSRDYDKMIHNSRLKIEKKFQNVPFELLYLRPRAYGHAFLWLAWKIMFDGGDPQKADYFSQQAILHYPQMRYFAKYLRLQLALSVIRLLGSNRYQQLKNLKHKLRGGTLQYHQ
jgi:glycosyltransferase involved in cell wall biosynthesis